MREPAVGRVEGVLLDNLLLVRDGQLREAELRALLAVRTLSAASAQVRPVRRLFSASLNGL